MSGYSFLRLLTVAAAAVAASMARTTNASSESAAAEPAQIDSVDLERDRKAGGGGFETTRTREEKSKGQGDQDDGVMRMQSPQCKMNAGVRSPSYALTHASSISNQCVIWRYSPFAPRTPLPLHLLCSASCGLQSCTTHPSCRRCLQR